MAQTFDLTGLALLEQTIQTMLSAPQNQLVGGQNFTGTYNFWPAAQGTPPAAGPMTTAQLQQRLINLRIAFDRLPL